MRVAYYSPMPPSRSGIADYSALLLPALRERVDVVVAEPHRRRRAPAADVCLYHVGNDPEAHGWIVEQRSVRLGRRHGIGVDRRGVRIRVVHRQIRDVRVLSLELGEQASQIAL